MTYTSPEKSPRHAPTPIEIASITGDVKPYFIHIVELMIEDTNAIEPIEKSNLPEFKLIDSANVVNITDATDFKKSTYCLLPLRIRVPSVAQRIVKMMNVAKGIATIPIVLFTKPFFVFI